MRAAEKREEDSCGCKVTRTYIRAGNTVRLTHERRGRSAGSSILGPRPVHFNRKEREEKKENNELWNAMEADSWIDFNTAERVEGKGENKSALSVKS